MGNAGTDKIRKVTTQLRDELLLGQLVADDKAEEFRPVPYTDGRQAPTWRIRMSLSYDPRVNMGLDVNGEVILGRGQDGANSLSLFNAADAEQLGVSRQHAMLRPTDSKLYITDLGSTNGTWLNGRSIGVNTPYSLSDGDILRFGRLEVVVQIVRRPGLTKALNGKSDIVDCLPSIARAITSQLDVKEVLKQAIEMTMSYAPADEITVWLVDEQTGELFLKAGQGVNDGQVTRLPVADTLAGKVIKTGKPLVANRQGSADPIKLKTNYLVEAVVYVPLTLGGVTFGVISAAHREAGKSFSSHDEKVMMAIADLAAVAVQNARLYQATKRDLNLRTKLVTASNYALSHDLKNLLNSMIGYAGLMEHDPSLNEETVDIARQIVGIGNRMSHLFAQLVEATTPSEDLFGHFAPYDLIDETMRVIDDLQEIASEKSIRLHFRTMGDPYLIQADGTHLYRSLVNLVENAIRYSPRGTQVSISLGFWHNDIIIRVQDNGPGIPEDDLPYLFDRYYRGSRAPGSQAGLGLGLELVRATVEAHRGTITARNAEDGGAEFIITLPASVRIQ
jgi:K+-sensing histidine kinase KdpD